MMTPPPSGQGRVNGLGKGSDGREGLVRSFFFLFVHSRYKRLKSNRGLRASRSRRCEIMAPATMAGPTKGKEGCLGTVGEA